jgi:multicomponent Na+:H+ antiporter subunit B
MNSILFRKAAQILVPLQILFALFLLVRGHNEPGGGFIGGLVAAAAFILHGLANGVPSARKLLRVEPQTLIGSGLLVAAASGFFAVAIGKPFMTGLWDGSIPIFVAEALKLGTPVLFDVGVFLVVAGVGTMIAFAFMEEDDA